MIDEFDINSAVYVNDAPSSNDRHVEIAAYDNQRIDEFDRQFDESRPPVRKKSGSASKLFTSLTAAVALAAAATVVAPYGNPAIATFLELSVSDTAVYYYVELENRNDDEYTVVLYNDFVRTEEIIEGESHGGEIAGLKPNMKYSLAVECKGKKIAKTEIKTLRTEDIPLFTHFYYVSYESSAENRTCTFFLDFIDENNYWSSFSVTLEVGDLSFEFDLADNPYAPQTAYFPSDFYPMNQTGTITVRCISTENSPNGEETVIHTQPIIIFEVY